MGPYCYLVKVGSKYFWYESVDMKGKLVDFHQATIFESEWQALDAIDNVVSYERKYINKEISIEKYSICFDSKKDCKIEQTNNSVRVRANKN